jgi:uncharacterized OB-fold protein
MTPGVGIWRCVNCHEGVFPQRLLCPRCHGAEFEPDRIFRAVVEEVAVIRHMLGQADWQPRKIANVRMADGLRITIGLLDTSTPGTVIELFEEDGAPYGAERKTAAPSA